MSQQQTLKELGALLAECRDKSRNNSLEGSADERQAWEGMARLLGEAIRLSNLADHQAPAAAASPNLMEHQAQTIEEVLKARGEGACVVGVDYPAGYGSGHAMALIAAKAPGRTLLACPISTLDIAKEALIRSHVPYGSVGHRSEGVVVDSYQGILAAMKNDRAALGRIDNLILGEAYPSANDPRDAIRAAFPDAFVVEQTGYGQRDAGVEVVVRVDQDMGLTVERVEASAGPSI